MTHKKHYPHRNGFALSFVRTLKPLHFLVINPSVSIYKFIFKSSNLRLLVSVAFDWANIELADEEGECASVL
ncbi:hypothetical protein AKJ16_DCAP19404 [Drosera capensis]